MKGCSKLNKFIVTTVAVVSLFRWQVGLAGFVEHILCCSFMRFTLPLLFGSFVNKGFVV